MFTLDEAREVLRARWGYQSFRKSQRAAMTCIGEGDDVLAVLPTGTGKSLLYQLPALLEEGGTIVVSPLIALMKDQVDDAVSRGIPAACINSIMDDDEQWDAVEGFVNGSTKLLYISPERIGARSFLTTIQRADVSIVAVDEAHCCHPAGTRVRTPNGEVAIETLHVGDLVVACDRDGRQVKRCVLNDAVVRVGGRGLFRLRFADGRVLDVTGDHKIWLEHRGYVEAKDVEVGDEALRALPKEALVKKGSGEGALLRQDLLRGCSTSRDTGATRPEARSQVEASRVVGVETLIASDPRRRGGGGEDGPRVYSLTVEGDHNYFAEGILVANCSQWGHQFRPDYMHIHRLIRSLSDGKERPQVLAMTATATPIVVEDIVQSLGLDREEVTILVDDPIRHNLRYLIEDGGIDGGYNNSWSTFRRLARDMDVRGGRHLVYCSSRNGSHKLAEICEDIHGDGIAVAYHAGLPDKRRIEVQDDFADENGRARIVCATTAFGMGIDVPDIRTVVLFGFPGSLEDYTQQIGRAGRDGQVSETILLGDQGSAEWQMRLIENENPPWQHYQLVWEHLHAMLQPGQSMRTNRNALSQEITAKKVSALSPDQVGVILNRLHSAGLLERRSIKEGVPITVDREALRQAIEEPGKAKPQIVHVWRTFSESCVEPAYATEKTNVLEVWINKTALKEQSGLTTYYVTRALESLQGNRKAVLNIGKAVAGLSVKIIKWRADLAAEMPVDRIAEKRDRDFARFNRLLAYARLRTEDARKQALRDYFLRTEDK